MLAPETITERRQAFEREALPHLRRVYAMARRLDRDPMAVEDLVQETYLRAYRTFDNYQRGTNPMAWLLTILHSIHVNRRRRRGREPEAKDDKQLETIADRAARDVDWEHKFVESAGAGRWGAGEAVDPALDRLPEAFREAVLLVDLGELTYEEAAGVLGCPVGTVRSRLARARRRLAAELADYAEKSGLFARSTT